MYKRKKSFLILIALFIIVLNGCSGGGQDSNVVNDEGLVLSKPGNYDSADTAMIHSIDTETKEITFYHLNSARTYTLLFDGATNLYNKHETPITISQINKGDIVDITFMKYSKRLNSLHLSSEAFMYEGITKFEIKEQNKIMKIGNDILKLEDSLYIISENKEIELMDINADDTLKIWGIGNSVYSITIEKGHGYLRLENDEYFIGGYIEIGQQLIRRITDDMLLVVPEGTYDILISNGGHGGTKRVTIGRNIEATLDVGDLKNEELEKFGTILLSIMPSNADVFIDGTLVDISSPIRLEYGLHQLLVSASGYQTLVQYLRVAEESAGISIELEEEEDATDSNIESSEESKGESTSTTSSETSTTSESTTESKSSTSVEGSTAEVTTTTYKVIIDSPLEVEVYVDGTYKGITPISFNKIVGSHVITLRKSGYNTRSYTIEIDNEKKDVTYSFSNLTPIE
ncbi:MAG: PEGA domain-containing protein [Lachnospiraceae bacterium]